MVNCNPLYTPRELEHQLKDSGTETIVILENFAHTLEQVIDRTAVKNVVMARLGDMLGVPKGSIVNFVVKYVKKMVPAWSLPSHVDFGKALSKGAGSDFKPVLVTQEDLAFLQYTGGTTGPVSYTHLDVYKRQRLKCATRWRCLNFSSRRWPT